MFKRQWEKLLLSTLHPKEDAIFLAWNWTIRKVEHLELGAGWGGRVGEHGNGLWQIVAQGQRSLHKALISQDLCRADGWVPGEPDVPAVCLVVLGPLFSEVPLL